MRAIYFLSMVLLAAFSAASWSAPADWYKWRSKIDSVEICSQTSPGDGWERAAGPFRDPRCEKRRQ
ncbi:hypothetical protein ACO0LB_18405 [Undibacterium sp. SXout7W]|uniref:hypothetical protein n=1 Tax=Undibacterium sp. SXout7W TaxID=3413049 RepID=UPI003BEFBA1E